MGEPLGFLLDRTAGVGVGWVRIDLVWAAVEPEPGVERWKDYDALVAAAELAASRSSPSLLTHPRGPPTGRRSRRPRNVADWSDFCSRAANRYRDQIHHWEVWNEPMFRALLERQSGRLSEGDSRAGRGGDSRGEP